VVDPAARTSWLDTFDPRTRIVFVLLAALTIVSVGDLLVAVGVFAAAAILLAVSRPTARRLGWRLLAIEGVLIGLVVTLPFSVPGDELWRVGPLTATVQGVERAALLGLRANAVAFVVLAVLGGLEVARVAAALAQLRLPPLLVQTLTFAVRYVEVLQRQAQRLREGMRARGFRPATNVHTYQTFGWFVAALFLSSLERSERVLDAMRCRGFDGTFHADDVDASLPRRDRLLLAGAGLLMVGTVLASLLGPSA